LVAQIVPLGQIDQFPPNNVAEKLALVLGAGSSSISREAKMFSDFVTRVRLILSDLYGKAPSYVRKISYEDAALEITKLLESDLSPTLAEVKESAPRFDRSKAPIIMDLLKRQIFCPLYIQHSPRVLFVISDKDEGKRSKILDAIYYMDVEGVPLFRNEAGEPSRAKLVEAVRNGNLPSYALEAHDYVHDIFEN
jgi:malate synthase